MPCWIPRWITLSQKGDSCMIASTVASRKIQKESPKLPIAQPKLRLGTLGTREDFLLCRQIGSTV